MVSFPPYLMSLSGFVFFPGYSATVASIPAVCGDNFCRKVSPSAGGMLMELITTMWLAPDGGTNPKGLEDASALMAGSLALR